jgi:hypothetical protein
MGFLSAKVCQDDADDGFARLGWHVLLCGVYAEDHN